MQWALYTEDDNVVLQFHGKNLRMPKHIEPDVRWIIETQEPFTGNLLPGQLTEDGRLVLIRRLLHEGFLRVAST
jgi:hypothetical protein